MNSLQLASLSILRFTVTARCLKNGHFFIFFFCSPKIMHTDHTFKPYEMEFNRIDFNKCIRHQINYQTDSYTQITQTTKISPSGVRFGQGSPSKVKWTRHFFKDLGTVRPNNLTATLTQGACRNTYVHYLVLAQQQARSSPPPYFFTHACTFYDLLGSSGFVFMVYSIYLSKCNENASYSFKNLRRGADIAWIFQDFGFLASITA